MVNAHSDRGSEDAPAWLVPALSADRQLSGIDGYDDQSHPSEGSPIFGFVSAYAPTLIPDPNRSEGKRE